MSYLAIELVGKRIELLKEWLPQIRRVAVLARPQHPGDHLERQATEVVVKKLGIEPLRISHISRNHFFPPAILERARNGISLHSPGSLRRARSLSGFCDVRGLRSHCPIRVGSQAAFGFWLVPVCPKRIADDVRAKRSRAISISGTVRGPNPCVAQSWPIFRSRCRPNSIWRLIRRRPRGSASKLHRRFSRVRTR